MPEPPVDRVSGLEPAPAGGQRRYWAIAVDLERRRAWLDAAEAHHALTVMRLRPGDPLEVIDGSGRLFAVEIERASPMPRRERRLATRILSVSEPEENGPRLWLVQALIRPARLEPLVDGATQLGVAGFLLHASARTTASFRPGHQRRERLLRLMRAATSQSLGLRLPELRGPVSFSALGEALDGFQIWVAHRPANSSSIRSSIRSPAPLPTLPEATPDVPHALVVGPEGGLAEPEVESLMQSGALLLDLGPRRLRSETAALAGLTLVLASLRQSERTTRSWE